MEENTIAINAQEASGAAVEDHDEKVLPDQASAVAEVPAKKRMLKPPTRLKQVAIGSDQGEKED